MYFSTAFEWLDWIGTLHTTEMDLGLERVQVVAARLGIKPTCPVIIVGGTNGKGSTVAGLEAIYRAAGFRTGAFTTPFLFRYNEQVRLQGRSASDDEFCAAFASVAAARGDVTLTPFEFMTLAALVMFASAKLDVWILEVGLGGRLDAVNIVDADVSIVTSIGIDHVQWLGETREAIAIEKAGIFRKGKPAVCGDPLPPVTLQSSAEKVGAQFIRLGLDFNYVIDGQTWQWTDGTIRYQQLPMTHLATQNMAIVLMGVTLLQDRLPVGEEKIRQGLSQVSLPGRQQVVPGAVTEIYDVSHNPAAVEWLADFLRSQPCAGKTYAVFSMLGDKDIAQSVQAIQGDVDAWFCAPLKDKRAASADKLKQAFVGIKAVQFTETMRDAFTTAKKISKAGDRIVVFGSFHAVSEVFH